MRVADLKQTSKERFTICFEDGSEVQSTLSVVAEFHLAREKNLDEEQIECLKAASQRSITLEKAIQLLSYRQMSRKEMFNKLIRKGIDAETAEYCSDKLVDLGLINDEKYAASVARHYARKGYGTGKVRAELARRGVERDLWDEAEREMPPLGDGLDRLIQKKLKDPNDREQVRKVSASLFRRGYSWSEIRSAIARFGTEADITEPEDY